MATVRISAPEASSARSRSSSDRKPPLPTMRREPQARPPSSNASARTSLAVLSATLDRPHYLYGLALGQARRVPFAARHDLALDGDRNAAALAAGARRRDRLRDASVVRELRALPVDL